MAEVVPEAYELVEHGLITDDDFRDFMFTNAVRFWGEVNPDFFKGTVVEKAAAEVLAPPAATREGRRGSAAACEVGTPSMIPRRGFAPTLHDVVHPYDEVLRETAQCHE